MVSSEPLTHTVSLGDSAAVRSLGPESLWEPHAFVKSQNHCTPVLISVRCGQFVHQRVGLVPDEVMYKECLKLSKMSWQAEFPLSSWSDFRIIS